MFYQQFVTFAKEYKLFDKERKRADSSGVFAECVANSPIKGMSILQREPHYYG